MTSVVDAPDISSKVGHYYRVDDVYEVGREKIREYARAVQDFHPAHWDEEAAAALGYTGLVAPLTFVSIPAMAANRELFESVVVGYDMFVQTEQVFEQHKPIVAGDKLVVDVELSSIRRIAGKDLITVTNTFADESGEVVHIMHTTVVGITGEGVDPEITRAVENVMLHGVKVFGNGDAAQEGGETPLRPEGEIRLSAAGAARVPSTTLSFDELTVGAELPIREARLSRGDLVNYAGVSGDNNPIHWDESIAKMAGLPDVIAHGMLTMGLGAGFVSTWSGDPGAVTRYGVRLSSTTIVDRAAGGEIEFAGRVKSVDPETRSAVIAIVAKSGGRKIFGLATATLRFR
ncbi:fused (3R)-hydroxyacyl-ACP dehydratase subunits HadA/HadB [Nocardia asteroides]|uniref:Oxidoreductase n=1 Tax=Nocardia asteroides NBRC 15531 TaxID=1110697 RepID=U5E843_NOCAS|nr:fused (3R)-hydroxyacyl-ACP dehydratase subunits HadA/HadB [Nocardia asteroides]TLF67250.1 (R)-hydratase [Nocardia asteroides NBRC 15531]UGT51463.1 fused (3R)-hydroxyacyl-ACP dehydratase subunits HadA/HadB [Nocardia asteroides]SFM26142.1 Acyl dehydratase [Nocardia asteroides]VEG35647.1 (3R)-hydroxyacyl-ACP dehydratase subunit HadB [Nocardia asteroides]GAD86192.1 putative oxidoreductase [Nocardia asteroides NBRC 15531]